MAAKRKKAKKSRKPAKRKGAKKTAKRKVAKKKAAPRRKPSARRKKLAKALAPSMERMKTSAAEMGHASIDAGRLLFDEAKETTKDAGEKVKDMTTDWINRVT
jgi:hypothetical protein